MPFRRITLATFVLATSLAAQQPYKPAAVTADDYSRAEKYLAAGVQSLTSGGSVQPNWLPDDRFWYRGTTASG